MKHIISTLFLSFAVCLRWSRGQHLTKFLPTLYVTSSPERPFSKQVVLYGATICDSGLYDGMVAEVRVNLPHGWDPTTGRVAKVEACKTMECSEVYCTNWPDHQFSGNHYCNFTYNAKTMGNIFVRATAGPSPNIDWTVGVELFHKEDWIPPPPVIPTSGLSFPEPTGRSGGQNTFVKVLMQIVRAAFEQKVQTLQRNAYVLRFCPDRQTTDKYTITISATALDTKSAMATYVCLPTQLPCSVMSSTNFDSRGIGVNTVHLSTIKADLSELHLTIVGWGDGNDMNTFALGATLKADT